MGTGIPLPRNPDGSIAYPGRLAKSAEASFGFPESSIPTWLAHSSTGTRGSSGVSTAATTGRGEAVLTTGAVANDQARYQFPDIDMSKSKVGAIRIDAEGLAWASTNVYPPILRIGFWAGAALGAYFRRSADDTHQVIVQGPTPGNVALPSEWTSFLPNRSGSFNIGFLMLPARGLLYVMEGDQEVFSMTARGGPEMGNGVVSPRFEIETTTAVAKTISIAKLSTRIWCY